MQPQALILHERDDVATAITDLTAGTCVHAALDDGVSEVTLCQDIPFGHKYALHDIHAGEEILKYGLPIGHALADIRAGEWVHIHNCRSSRYGFHNDKYGARA